MTTTDREKFVNSMVDLHLILKKLGSPLQMDTLFLAVSLFDRFLGERIVAREKLPLLMTASFYLASKFEDTNYPMISDLLVISKQAFTKDDMLMMERILLHKLGFRMGAPTAYTFLRRYVHCCECENTVGLTARFLAELSLMSYSLSTRYPPSMVAASALAFALAVNGKAPWSKTLQTYSGYAYEQLHACMVEMREIAKRSPLMKYQTTYAKYSSENYLQVASNAVKLM